MTESRKRPFSDDEDSVSTTKKRATTISRTSSPQLNGISEDDESPGMDNVELFRKEAIFRRMKHYAREFERSQTRISELELQNRTCEMGLAAVTACWTQLIETIKPLIQSQQAIQLTSGLLDFQMHVGDDWKESLQQALEAKLGATTHLIHTLSKQDARNQTVPSKLEEREKLVEESTILKSQLDILQSNVKHLEEEKTKYHEALTAAENRLARQRSSTIQAMETRAATQQKQATETEAETQGKPSSPREQQSPTQTNGVAEQFELNALRDGIQLREKKLQKAEAKIGSLETQLLTAKAGMTKEVTDESLNNNRIYRELYRHARLLRAALEQTQNQLLQTSNELSTFQMARQGWETESLVSATKTINELKAMLHKRDEENARLRDQREQQQVELNEHRQEAKDRLDIREELKKLTQSQAERIVALQGEVARYKAGLAQNAGNKELAEFLLNAKGDEVNYIGTLEARVKAAESKATAFQQATSALDTTNPEISRHVQSEAAALERLSLVEKELAQYKSTFGDSSSSSSDLAAQLRSKQELIEALQETETSLCGEVDRLSTAWHILESDINKKLFELAEYEERIRKSSVAKAKSDNRYFSVMREKDQADQALKNALINAEKQSQTVQLLQTQQQDLKEQVKSMQSENSTLTGLTITYKNRADILEARLRDAEMDKINLRGSEEQTMAVMREHDQIYASKMEAVRQVEDNLNRSKREIEQRQKDFESLRKGGENEEDDDNKQAFKMLMCVCRKNLRDTVITKCMHTFCKYCVEARISTRQRRCPSCNAGFAQSEVQNLYFQM